MTYIPLWANGPFELLIHGETHFLRGDDFDRRIALISFDNSIEIAITTYLTLHPEQRGNRQYVRVNVENWLNDYHSKLDFLEFEIESRDEKWVVEKENIIWVHRQRNEQYHGGNGTIPELRVLDIARKSALWVFSFLFELSDAETELENTILSRNLLQVTNLPEDDLDEAIDSEYDIIEIGEQAYLASEVLYAVDYTAYRDIGETLNSS